jgi:hypothetical protein
MSTKTTVKKLEDAVNSFKAANSAKPDLETLSVFYERMKREGIAVTRKYNLPQLDTLGRALQNRRS